MSALTIGLIVFAFVFGSAMLGMFLGGILPEHHLEASSKDVVKLGTGLIATMAALVLSLLVSSAKETFDKMNDEMVESAAKVLQLDRILSQYGPETRDIRGAIKRYYTVRVEQLSSGIASQIEKLDTPEAVTASEALQSRLRELSPHDDHQRGLQVQAEEIATDIAATRWLLLLQRKESIPLPFLIVLVCWLSIIFAAFGLFAPRNTTVIAVLFLCALSASGAVFLILEMENPLGGLIRISSAPLRTAVAHLGE